MKDQDKVKIFRDYRWDIPKRLIYRKDLDEKKHLVHSMGNLPAFNKTIVEEYASRVEWWGASTKTFKYLIRTKDLLEGDTITWAEPQLTNKDRSKWVIKPRMENLKLL